MLVGGRGGRFAWYLDEDAVTGARAGGDGDRIEFVDIQG